MNKQVRMLVSLVMVTLAAVGPKIAWLPTAALAADLATTITVTTTADELFSDGDCSLREAIQAANQNKAVDKCAGGGGDDVIQVPAGVYLLTLAGGGEDGNASGDLDIQSNLTINGTGAASTTIDGSTLDRVLHILGTQTRVVINDATVTNGRADVGGGIYNQGTLTLARSVVGNNQADFGGGGIFNTGTLTVVDSTIRDNHSVHSNGSGGGIDNNGNLGMTNSTIRGNSSANGGGGLANSGTATLTSVTISGNRTDEQGGGLISFGGTKLTLTNSTLHANDARYGGAISTFGALTLLNSTISGNHAAFGAGIYLQLNTVRLQHSTISANRAIGAAGILSGFQGKIILANSLVANQLQGEDCLNPDGVITSDGHNLDSDNTCNLNATTDLPSSVANLGPLQDNGGATWTHALLPGSAAIDRGECLGGTLTQDQRGVARPQASQCDIGSYETTGAAIALRLAPDTQTIAGGATATFTLTLTNTGSIALTNITVADPLAPACDRVVDMLAALAVISYSCTRPAVPTSFANAVGVTAATAVGDRLHANDVAFVRLIGWSDLFLPLVAR